MKLVLFNYLKCHIDLKKIVFSVLMIVICLGGLKIGVNASSPFKVLEAYKNQQSTKYKLTVSQNIQKITDENGVPIIPERLSGKSILFYNNGATQIRVYSSQEEYVLVDLASANIVKDVNPPNILWKYKNKNENTIYMALEDVAGLYEIKNINRSESLRAILTKMPKDIVVSFDAQDVKNQIEIYDVFGNVSELNIDDITLNVSVATKSINGDIVVLKLENEEHEITNITYIDDAEIARVGKYKIERIYNVSEGTTRVVVNYGDEHTVIPLATDVKPPEAIRVWKKSDGSKILIEAKDGKSGIGKVNLYNSETKNEEILKMVSGIQMTYVVSGEVLDGTTHVYVYDGVGNKLKLDMSKIPVDTEKPTLTLKYENGKYIITAQERNSGIAKIKFDDREVGTFEDCPTHDIVYEFDNLDDIEYIYAYSGVGDVTVLNLNGAISNCSRMYKNAKGNLISITVEDVRGIVKITDQDDRIIERLFGHETKVSGVYKVRSNIQSIKVFYEEDKSYTIDLEMLVEPPQVRDEIIDDGLITDCTVESRAGIKSIEYSNGKKILFKTDMPDDIEVDCTVENDDGVLDPVHVTVYDALGNSVDINEALA